MRNLNEYIEESILDNDLEKQTDSIVDKKSKLDLFKSCLGQSKSVKVEFNSRGRFFVRNGICFLDLKKYKQIIPLLKEHGIESEYQLFIQNFKGKASDLGTSNWSAHSLKFENCILDIDSTINCDIISFNHTDITKWSVDQKWESANYDDWSAHYLAHDYIDDHCKGVKIAAPKANNVRKRGTIKI